MKKSLGLNICLSSTVNWNPGDEFIRFGVKNLMEKIIGNNHNYFIWNRNPDFFNSAWKDDRVKENFLSNSCSRQDLSYMDLFVFAGTPEWLGNPTEPLYKEIARRNAPALFLGLGAGRDIKRLTKTEKKVLNADTSFVSSRSNTLAEELNQEDVKGVHTLPCPAVLCVKGTEYAPRQKTGKIGFLLQTTEFSCQNSKISFAQEFFNLLPNPNYEFLASYIAETRVAAQKGIKARFSFEPQDYFAIYQDYDFIITTRLHGALSALSAGIPAILVTEPANERVQTAAVLYKEILPVVDSIGKAVELLSSYQTTEIYEAHRRKIMDFKASVEKLYLPLLEEFCDKFFC
ncbi:MAG: polysaccharide pyruvyl transferase family protein [Elusimicrobiaceae bacterium]|nr:polysaccharide pyruvyl transferase family protein [Elusimicrobiaceae bacterium]